MNTWNGLPSRYWDKVLATIRAALNGLICDSGLDKARSEPVDTRGISYNQAAMEALLEEPQVQQREMTRVDQPIPIAREVYFEAENGVDDVGNQEEEEEALPGELREGEITEGEEGSGGSDEEEEEEGSASESEE